MNENSLFNISLDFKIIPCKKRIKWVSFSKNQGG